MLNIEQLQTYANCNKDSDAKKAEVISFLDGFHTFTKAGDPKEVIDSLIVDDIIVNFNIIVLEGVPYIYEGGNYNIDEGGILLKDIIKRYIYQELVNINRLNRVYNLLLVDNRIIKGLEDVNKYPTTWINFKNGMLDVKNMTMKDHKPEYYAINQIPHDYIIGYEIPADSIALKCLMEKIPNDEDREMDLQFKGYSMTLGTNQQKFLMYVGDGNTGKSTLIRNHNNMIGKNNYSSLSLQDLNKRFYPTCLVGKLVNSCADIPSETMEKIDTIKKVTGEDEIMGEYKGGKQFFFHSYAKLIFSANSVPLSYDDKTNAYYRRLMIINIQRGNFISNLEELLFDDMQSYIHLCVDAFHRMLVKGRIEESENSKQAVDELYRKTDTVHSFIADKCIIGNDYKVMRADLYDNYSKYCSIQDRTALTKHNFYSNLRDKGYQDKTGQGALYIKGLKLKQDKVSEEDYKNIPFKL